MAPKNGIGATHPPELGGCWGDPGVCRERLGDMWVMVDPEDIVAAQQVCTTARVVHVRVVETGVVRESAAR